MIMYQTIDNAFPMRIGRASLLALEPSAQGSAVGSLDAKLVIVPRRPGRDIMG